MPRVSIVMTVYNAAPYVDQAIGDVLRQSFHDFELIVVDNASTDRSASIIKSFSDSRIVPFYLGENIGRTKALNFACQQAAGEYVAILDADDLTEPDRLAVQVAFMDGNRGVGIVAGWARLIDEGGRLKAYYLPPAWPALVNEILSWSMPIVHSTLLIRRSILMDELQGYSPDFAIGQDWELCVRVAERYPVCVLGQILGAWRRYPASVTGARANYLRGRAEAVRILERARPLAKTASSIARNRRERAVNLLAIAYYSLLNGDAADCLGYLRKALTTDYSCVFRNQRVRNLFLRPIPDHHRTVDQ
jgi:glycosyltransferase involved in cell wall biosynthesis